MAFYPAPQTLTTASAGFELALHPRATRRIFLRCGLNGAAQGDWTGRTVLSALCAPPAMPCRNRASVPPASTARIPYTTKSSPLGLGSVHAHHRHAPGTLPVCGHSLVQHALRARRHHHGAHDAVARPQHRHVACSDFSPLPRRPRSSRSGTPSPGRFCTRCAMERWRICARCRSAATTAASTRRRCSCCCSASISGGPATLRRCVRYGRTPRRRSPGSIATGTATATVSSNITARRRRVSRIKDGRIPSTRFSIKTAAWRKDRSRCAKCRPTSTAPNATPPCWPRRWAFRSAPTALAAQAESLREKFEAQFWCEELSTYALALDGAKQPCRVDRVERRTGAVHRYRLGRACPARCAHALLAGGVRRLGHPHRRARRNRATTRCLITTARSGRTTTA